MVDLDNYDCQNCGACCVSDFDAPDYVHVSNEEAEPFWERDLGKLLYEERTYGAPAMSMRTREDECGNCRCIALSGTVGKDVSCSVYDIRPNVCRNFEPGTDVCDYARQLAFGVSKR